MTVRPSRRLVCWTLLAVFVLASLAVGSGPARADDVVPEPALANWRQVAAGSSHTCGIRTTGRLYCWGYDASGQLGDGGPDADQPTPVEVFGGGTNWARVAAGEVHTCALKTTGRLFCWGSDASGQVGNGGSNVNQAIPVEVAGGATNWTAVSAGGNVTCALKTSGRLSCWGTDLYGQLGNGPGSTTSRAAPAPVAGPATNWTSVSVGTLTACGRRATGRLYCWGLDLRGQLGDGGPNQDRQAPVPVAGGFTDWRSVTVGDYFACGLRSGGLAYCWGSDDEGELGNGGGAVERNTPVRIAGSAAIRWSVVDAGRFHVCARRTDGRLLCWGGDGDGALGNGGSDVNRQSPTPVMGGGTSWARPAPGYRHSCALRTSGRLFCWGFNGFGQVGNGGPGTQTTPARVL